ncbi:MAG TPA: serine/threonine-protein kinase [Polyangiaceae bacterium]|nr:serine/threonine-protein kinase [Polyangiaceae bacterium]
MNPADDAVRAASLIGSTLVDRYRVDAVLGAATASATFRVMDLREGAAALKVFYPEYMRGDAGRRFLRDSSALVMLRHPHLVETLGAGSDTPRGLSFFTRTLIVARSLDQVLAEIGVLEPVAAVRMALHAARGVNAAHRVGVLHRNVKPENLFLELRPEDQMVVRVADFGSVRLAADLGPDAGPNDLPPGAPDYLAPEQLKPGQEVDERVDVWGLGAVLYEMLTGSPPFGHLESAADVAAAIPNDDAPHVQDRAPWVDPALALVVHRALSRDQARRFATMEDLAEALRPLAGGDEQLAFDGVATVSESVRAHAAARADLVSQPPPESVPPARPRETDELGLVGRRLDKRYKVVRLIGRGGMGAVYEVEDDGGRRLAAKLISRGLAGENHPALVRFAREARAASVISSPNVVATYDAGSDDELGLPYIIMELLHGTDLSSVLKREGPLEPQVAVRLVLQAARGIAAAHARNVIHRDVKPANLFLQVAENTEEVTVKVCDFGVAKRTRMDETLRRTSGLSLTRTGGMLGSPMYMAPEQARNAKHVDERADIWSIAVVLWEALSGKRLWGAQTSLGELIVAICTEPLQRLEDVAPWVPRDLARLVHRGLERDLSHRTPSMQAFIAALEVFSGGSDRVTAEQLVGLSDEHREVLAKRAGTLSSGRPLDSSSHGVTAVPTLTRSPLATLQIMTRPPVAPAPSSSTGWIIGVILAIVAAGAAIAFMR